MVRKKIETGGKMKTGISAKGAAKTQGSTAPNVVGPGLAVISRSVVSPSVDGAIPGVVPVVQAVVTGVTVPEIGSSKAMTEGRGEAVSGMAKTSTGGIPIVNASVPKYIVHDAKPAAIETESGLPFTDDRLETSKSGIGLEKVAATVAIPLNDDGDSKTQSVSGMTAGQVHAMTGGTASIAYGAVTSDTPKGNLAAGKLPVAEASVHTADLQVSSREQDRAGAVALSMDGAPRMMMATPTSIEVGIQNGTHGWLKVRAEMTEGGVVNASVSAASSAGQEMLHRELPALTAYLQEEKVAVNAVIVHSPSASGSDPRSSSAADGAGGQTPQRSNQGEEQHQSLRKPALNGSDGAMTYRSLTGVDEDGSLPLAAYASSGSWLSVRA
jgi:hypothetical protein